MPTRPKQIDLAQVEQRLAAGESQSAIARSLGVAQSTLSQHLAKAQRAAQAPHLPRGGPQDALGPPQPDQAETAALTGHTTPLTHLGRPENTHGGPHASKGSPDVYIGGPLTAQDLQDLQPLLAWWRARRQQQHEPAEKLERVTYHVAPRWIEAVKREADLTGESYAAIVNRAFAQYFAGKST